VPRLAEARCAPSSLSVWPPSGGELPANGRIALEGYGTEQDFIRSIAGRSPRLLSGSRSIPLQVAEVHEGAFRVTQAILVPESPLEPGRRYVLSMDGRRRIPVWNGSRRGPAAWTAAAADTAAPTWDSAPIVGASTLRPYGCGPAISGHVAVAGPSRVRVHLEPEAGGDGARTYEVGVAEGELQVGHGMCNGPFQLDAGARYRATLTAIDAAGNQTPAPGGPVILVGPTR